MSNKNHHGPHCAGLCEGQAYSSRIKELEGDNERLRGDAAEAEGVIRGMYEALDLMLQRYGYETCEYVQKAVDSLTKAKGRGD